MKIGVFGLWMIATVLVGGTFVFTQISHVSISPHINPAKTVTDNQVDEAFAVQNKWSVEELEKIKENPPFKLVIPNDSILSTNTLTGAYMSKVKGGSTNDMQVNLYYKTPRGNVSIWETNMEKFENDILNSYETMNVGGQEWNYDKDLNILYSSINGLQIQISGQVPKQQLLNIIKSLNTNN